MSGDHAKFAPSAAERWFNCPGSIVLSEGMPEVESAYADEGSEAHDLAAKMLTGEPCAIGWTAEMRDQVRKYVDHMEDLKAVPDAVMQVEQRVEVTAECWGRADGIVWHPDTKVLYVRDLKYGAGVVVEVEGNLQLKIYALGALLTSGFPAHNVDTGIVQPRIPHPDGVIRSTVFPVVDLVDFHADLLEAIERVKKAQLFGDLVAGWRKSEKQVDKDAVEEWDSKYLHPTVKGCRFCPAAAICPKVRQLAQDTAKKVFSVATIDNRGVLSYDPEDLARTLDNLPILESWIKNVREFAYAEAEKGHAIPGHKLVAKRANRKWRNETDAADTLEMYGVDCWEQRVIKSPAEVEKLLPRAQRGILASLVTKESSGHTLVPESDPRPAVDLSAKGAFAELPATDGEADPH